MSWKWFFVKLLIGLVAVPSLVLGSFYVLDRHGFFNVEKIEIALDDSGQKVNHLKAQAAALEQMLERQRGHSLWSLNLENLSFEVEKLPWVKSSHLVRVWPSTLRLKILPQTVPLVYRSDRGELFPVLANGMLLESVPAVAVPDVVILTGDVFAKKIKLRAAAAEVIEKIPESGTFSRKTISEMGYDSKEGFWMSLMTSGLRVKLGENDFSLKSQRVSQVVDYLENHKFDARVIDANLSQKVLVRLRKDP